MAGNNIEVLLLLLSGTNFNNLSNSKFALNYSANVSNCVSCYLMPNAKPDVLLNNHQKSVGI